MSINALAAVLGGVQTLHTSAFDEALGVPTEAAATLALRRQQVILEETGIPNVVDPLGGSYAIEAEQVERLRRVRATRDAAAVREALSGLERAARDGTSIVQPTIVAVRAYATVGEISETLRGVFGSYEPDAVA